MGLRFRELEVGGTAHRWALHVPDHGEGPWPCVVFLHGSGECGTDGEQPTRVGLLPAVREHPERWPCVVVMPQKPRVAQTWRELEALVLGTLDAARGEVAIDPERIALTGVSQGGHGTWALGAARPGLWSRLAPVCGSARPDEESVARRIAHLPVWAFHGRMDMIVNPDDTRRMVDAARAARAAPGEPPGEDGVRMTIYPWVGHDCWNAVYAEEELPAWLLERRRPGR